MKKYIVTLTNDERELLNKIASKGTHKSQKVINALLLLGCDEGNFQYMPRRPMEILKHTSLP